MSPKASLFQNNDICSTCSSTSLLVHSSLRRKPGSPGSSEDHKGIFATWLCWDISHLFSEPLNLISSTNPELHWKWIVQIAIAYSSCNINMKSSWNNTSWKRPTIKYIQKLLSWLTKDSLNCERSLLTWVQCYWLKKKQKLMFSVWGFFYRGGVLQESVAFELQLGLLGEMSSVAMHSWV